MKFEKGDIVQVHYASPSEIEKWMRGWLKVGPGDIGVVRYTSPDWLTNELQGMSVTVCFPMIGTIGVHSSHLRIVAKASEKS